MRRLLSVFLLFLSACSPLVTSTPQPSPQVVQVAFTPTLSNWREKLHICALDQPGMALITKETTAIDSTIWDSNITLWFGEPLLGVPNYAVVLGEDEIVVIAGRSIGLQNLSHSQLRALYTDPESIYQTWTFPEGNELRVIFDQTVFEGNSPALNSYLAPSPEAMLEAISANSLAIGYIPKSWLVGNEKTITLEDDLVSAFERPILGLTTSEPEGEIGVFLTCLQNTEP